jgi:hypothetical protein
MAGELRATILSTLKGDAAEKLAKQLDGVSGRMEKFGSIAGKAVKGVASLGAALVSSKFIGDSIEQAKNLERSILALDSVFGSTAPRMVEFSKNAVSMGLSQSEAAKASTFLGSVLQQYGFSADDAAVETEKLTKLSADLAATYGYDVQEALLAVTALFRGEYDPIEKFGVAMKQNEINAVRTARGLGDLTGAAEMQADAQIRLELLMERSTSAQGAMERGAGTLYVETEKLRATFENLQANIGQELIPVFAELFERLRPIIEDSAPALAEIFEFVAEVVGFLGQTLTDLFDPTTMIGESFAALGNQFESLFQTIFGRDFDLAIIFEVATNVLNVFINAIHDLLRIIENVIIAFQAVGAYIHAAFTGDWASVARKGIKGIADEMYAARDAATATALQMDILYAKAARSLDEIGDQTEVWNVIGRNAAASGIKAGEDYGTGVGAGLKVEKDAIKEFWDKLYEDIERESARLRLEALGASEGLIAAILGAGEDWQKVFDSIVSGGLKAVEKAQLIFNQTAGGLKEIEEAAKKAKEAVDKLRDIEVSQARSRASANDASAAYYNTYANMIEAGFEKEVAIEAAREELAMAIEQRNAEIAAEQRRLSEAFAQSSRSIIDSFNSAGVREQLGEYAQAVQSLRSEMTELINENERADGSGLFSSQVQQELIGSLNEVADIMFVIGNARDRIVGDIESAQSQLESITGERKSLFESIVDSIMGGVNVTQLGGSSRTIIRNLERTLEQTKMFAAQIDQLRTMGLGESAIQQIIDSGAQVGGATAKALLKGGAGAISEVNTLYAQINGVAEEIGNNSASVMFDAGISTMQGLVDGLLAQESELERAAKYLASSFENAFNEAATSGQVRVDIPTYDSVMDAVNTMGVMQAVGATGPSYSSGSGVFNITVNAGMGADGQSLGRIIVDEIKKFERQSGRVFVSA